MKSNSIILRRKVSLEICLKTPYLKGGGILRKIFKNRFLKGGVFLDGGVFLVNTPDSFEILTRRGVTSDVSIRCSSRITLQLLQHDIVS